MLRGIAIESAVSGKCHIDDVNTFYASASLPLSGILLPDNVDL
jgi:hypothetical protein